MKKLIVLLVAVLFLIGNIQAQTSKAWKNQIYVGFNKSCSTKLTVAAKGVDINWVTKQNWLFNAGVTHSEYSSVLNPSGSSLFFTIPKVKINQFNFSAGHRFDLLPKWSISLFSGLSYTKCKFPSDIVNHYIKYNVGVYTFGSNITGARMDSRSALGVHLNGELNFYLCENMEMHVGYMYDFNNAHRTGGFTFGARLGVMKQKHGTRRISGVVL